ncbi:hypothetical protein KY290_007200 [Solanum tuberosum]|uniref:Uncharacterized protein n=1 Tax=Solanum tuberosum TaxID=4113 RepID=A0ABQ7W4W5_SOLTU|nr:hypothetical protein KY290_007200 [Solanum tuberosum]
MTTRTPLDSESFIRSYSESKQSWGTNFSSTKCSWSWNIVCLVAEDCKTSAQKHHDGNYLPNRGKAGAGDMMKMIDRMRIPAAFLIRAKKYLRWHFDPP